MVHQIIWILSRDCKEWKKRIWGPKVSEFVFFLVAIKMKRKNITIKQANMISYIK